MGLKLKSTAPGIEVFNFKKIKGKSNDKVVALAGNPNVGKSTVFNDLTGMNQHTGNWPGKTVDIASGKYVYKDETFILVDIPGTYSLMANSSDEKIARDFICFGEIDAIVAVVDATCIERNLNLVLQILEITQNVVVCVNLLDEADKKGIKIDLEKLSLLLGVPVIGTDARSKAGIDTLKEQIHSVAYKKRKNFSIRLIYDEVIERSLKILEPAVSNVIGKRIDNRWIALKLLDDDNTIIDSVSKYLGYDLLNDENILENLFLARQKLLEDGIDKDQVRDKIVSGIVSRAHDIYRSCVYINGNEYTKHDRKIDKILTSRSTGILAMLLMLSVILWITIVGANYPSKAISSILFGFEDNLIVFLKAFNMNETLIDMLISGVYKTVVWVVSVMLPPMAIFFPLFTLLEDYGYLPRIAFNLDKFFRNANSHGKQALTMCMGFGCNACGVMGCRIIDSKRERNIAILTNNFVPCNGRFPTLIAIITMFFSVSLIEPFKSIVSSMLLSGIIVFGIIMTLMTSKILSKTVLKGMPSSFVLELPPYRKPQICKVIVRSVFDKTLFVLKRAVSIALPAGLIIWLMANVMIGEFCILEHCSRFLDPFARLIGLDGVILMAFILGFPANEIVIPIIIMAYLSAGSMMEFENLIELKALLVSNGWTWLTALCTMLFSLMHFPCGTTLLTIKKETQSLKLTLLSFILPTISGIVICFIVANLARFFNLV